jgi:two-component system sensor histidine kinase BaeS
MPDEDAVLPDPIGWRLLAIVALVGVVAVVGTVVAARRLLRPIGALTGAAHRMGEGDLGERVSVGGSDEIAVLAEAFNTMADSLEEQDRLRRIMTGDIAHELRTPLSNIRGYLEALREGVLEPTPEIIASLHDEAVLLQGLVDDLQDLALAEAGELRVVPEETDLVDLLERSLAPYRPRAEAAGISIDIEVDSPAHVAVDRGRMRQVVGNLLDNALRHTPSGGRVTVGLRREGGATLISVADTGPGIPQEHLPNVFERFYRADPSRHRATGGSGLGLAIARELVRAHGGEISVESRPGAGTIFTIRLPGAVE